MEKIILVKENLIQSILSDLATFGFLLFSVWFNYKFVNGSYFLNGVILVMFMLFLFGKFQDKQETFTNKQDLINWANANLLEK